MNSDNRERSAANVEPASGRIEKDKRAAGTLADVPEFELNGHPTTARGERIAGSVRLGDRAGGDILVARHAKHGAPVIGLKEGVVEGRAAMSRIGQAAEDSGITPKIDRGHPRVDVTHWRFTVPKETEKRPSEDAVADFVGRLETLVADFRHGKFDTDADLAARVPRGTYGVFDVLGGDDAGDILVACPYGKQSPLKRLGARFDWGRKAWRVDVLRADELRKALDRAVKRAEKERKQNARQGPVEGSLDPDRTREDTEARKRTLGAVAERWRRGGLGFSPKRLSVRLSGGRFVVAFPYAPEAVAKVKSVKGARFERSAKTWSIPAERIDDMLMLAPEIDRIADAAERAREEARGERKREARLERAERARRDREKREERGLKTRYRLSAHKGDTARGEIQWIEGWPFKVVAEKKEFNDEPTSIALPGIGFAVEPYWAIRMECEPLADEEARPLIDRAEAEQAEKERRRSLWGEFMGRLRGDAWTDEGDDRPSSRGGGIALPRKTARRIAWSREIGVVQELFVDEERALLVRAVPIWDGGPWTRYWSSPLRDSDRDLIERVVTEFGGKRGSLTPPSMD